MRVSRQDADFWLSTYRLKQAKVQCKGYIEKVMAAIKPYQVAGHFKPFSGNGKLSPGISANGRTPGHSVYQVTSQGKKLLLLWDLIHVAAMQILHPKVATSFNNDARAAVAQRLRVLGYSARQSELVGSAHLSFPGLGYLNCQGEGYTWVPLTYGAL